MSKTEDCNNETIPETGNAPASGNADLRESFLQDLYNQKDGGVSAADAHLQDGSPGSGDAKTADPGLKPGDGRPDSTSDQSMKTARQSLELNLASALDPIQDKDRIKSIKNNLNKIDERVSRNEISSRQAAETYQNVERLLTDKATTNLTDDQRQALAEQVLANAAEPTRIDQGKYNTCNVTAGEVLAYSRTPERAAKLVADVALNGNYTARYNNPYYGQVERTVEIDPTPHGESLLHPAPDGTREHASEIFQVTAVNLAYNASDEGSYRYRQTEPDPDKPWDTGERFEQLDPATGLYRPYIQGLETPPNPADADAVSNANAVALKQVEEAMYMRNFQPNLQPAHMALSAEIVTGQPTVELQAGGQNPYQGGNAEAWKHLVRDVENKEDLYEILKTNKESNGFPVMATINCAKEPFASDLGRTAGGEPVWHNISVHGLAEVPGQEPRVLISNQWGDKDDRLSWDRGIPISEFMEGMRK